MDAALFHARTVDYKIGGNCQGAIGFCTVWCDRYNRDLPNFQHNSSLCLTVGTRLPAQSGGGQPRSQDSPQSARKIGGPETVHLSVLLLAKFAKSFTIASLSGTPILMASLVTYGV